MATLACPSQISHLRHRRPSTKNGRLCPAPNSQFPQDVANMNLDRHNAQEERASYLLVGSPVADKLEDISLSGC